MLCLTGCQTSFRAAGHLLGLAWLVRLEVVPLVLPVEAEAESARELVQAPAWPGTAHTGGTRPGSVLASCAACYRCSARGPVPLAAGPVVSVQAC